MAFTIKDIDVSLELADKARSSVENKNFFYRFDKQLETIFTRYRLSRYQVENRLYPLLGAIGLVAFLFADSVVIPDLLPEMIMIRGLGASVILFLTVITYFFPLYRWQQLLLCVAGLSIHVSLVAIGVIAANHGQYHYQFGSIITIFFLTNVMRIGFIYALPFALLMLATQVICILLLTDVSIPQMTEMFSIYAFVTCTSLIVNGRMEHETRKNFLRQLLLKFEHKRLIKTQAELKSLSISDTLTGLYNRRYFNKYIEREWLSALRYKTPLSVLMIDIDNFKIFNDTYGHLSGDEALSQVGQALSLSIKRPDDIIARYGGEEFIAVLPHSDSKAAIEVANTMLSNIRSLGINHQGSAHDNIVTISIGCSSVIPDQAHSTKNLLKSADDALYESKRKGKNCISEKECRIN